jgi:hypothetical protein
MNVFTRVFNQSRYARFVIAAAGIGLATPCVAQAQSQPQRAQLTAKDFLKDSIDAVGAKHAPVDEAIKAMTNRAPDRAFTLLQSAKTADKKLPPPEVLMAKMFLMGQNVQAGRAWLEKAVVAYPAEDARPTRRSSSPSRSRCLKNSRKTKNAKRIFAAARWPARPPFTSAVRIGKRRRPFSIAGSPMTPRTL